MYKNENADNDDFLMRNETFNVNKTEWCAKTLLNRELLNAFRQAVHQKNNPPTS